MSYTNRAGGHRAPFSGVQEEAPGSGKTAAYAWWVAGWVWRLAVLGLLIAVTVKLFKHDPVVATGRLSHEEHTRLHREHLALRQQGRAIIRLLWAHGPGPVGGGPLTADSLLLLDDLLDNQTLDAFVEELGADLAHRRRHGDDDSDEPSTSTWHWSDDSTILSSDHLSELASDTSSSRDSSEHHRGRRGRRDTSESSSSSTTRRRDPTRSSSSSSTTFDEGVGTTTEESPHESSSSSSSSSRRV